MKIHLWMVLVAMVALPTCSKRKAEPLTIATAANMQFAMKALIEAFREQTGVSCEPIISSSGKLTAQIKEGAPFHVFVSADMKYPNDLYKNGFTIGKPEIYTQGKLVLWTMKSDLKSDITLLDSEQIRHIAIANPKTAPYGAAALEVLHHYGLLEKIRDKLVYGESISQTNQFITTTAAELGFTAKSVVLSPEMENTGNWTEIDPEIYSPISQGVVILNNNESHLEKAQQFYGFLFSNEGKEILEKFGYSMEH